MAFDDDDYLYTTSGTDAMLWMFVGLGLGLFTMQILNRRNSFINCVPYTVCIFVFGILFALYLNEREDKNDTIDISLESWLQINPELMLFIFLPPLIFGEAMRQNMFFFNKALGQSFLLAFPGVIINAMLIAGLSKVIVPSWNFNLCCLFGSVLSATDTVSVVSILHSAAASPKLSIIIVGESLGNDGTSLMLFELFLMILLSNNEVESIEIVKLVARSILLSPLLGIVTGFLTYLWLRSLKKAMKETDVLIQIGITLCSCYLTFYFAQYTFESSGVLAVAVSGLVVASLSGPVILNKESMENIWQYIEWIGNTLIFLLAGLITGHKVLKRVDALDWVILFCLYLVVNICRFLTVFILWPLLKNWGYGMTYKEALFISFAGLRGALALALAVTITDDLSNPDTSKLFFFVGGVVTMSLLINGSFCRAVLDYLNLKNENSIENTIIVDRLRKRISKKLNKIIQETCKENQFSEDERASMATRCSILRNIEPSLISGSAHNNIEVTDNLMLDEISETSNLNAIKSISTNTASASVIDIQRKRFLSVPTSDNVIYTRTFNQSMDRFKSILPYSSSSRVQSRVDRITGLSRLLSKADRGSNPTMLPEVLKYVRTIYLEIVRTNYWKGIESGKLQRTSYAVQFLIYSVDLGLDEISKGLDNWYIGLKDFDYIHAEIMQTPTYLHILKWLTETTRSAYLHSLLSQFEARRLKRTVVILQSFIEAHTYAAKKIHSFIVDDEGTDEASADYLPEEIRVKDESLRQVDQAKKLLNTYIDPQTILLVKSTQATLGVLEKESEIIRNMINEGLITHTIGELFFAEIGEDRKALVSELSALYKKRHPLIVYESGNNDSNHSFEESLLS